ncbi:MAG: cobalt ECF transporter T component CbiQ [Geobacteraceae bacterium GWC2_53_11]|nr:MAG: cobalt ECF transporter T component CbiQ [Geobacteraceae bacterium GWC2_53_11]
MYIDTYAYSNRWRKVHPGEKGLFALLCLTSALLSRTALLPLAVAAITITMTVLGAGIPWRNYLRLALLPALFLLWSCLALAVSFSGGEIHLAEIPFLHLTISLSRQGIDQAELALARSLGASLSLLFLALTTPMTEIMGLLRSLGAPRLMIELMTIAYRQIFVFLEITGQIRAAQEARLGYASPRLAMKSLAGLTGNILLRSLSRARQNHQALLARGYDSKLRFLSPPHNWSPRNLAAAVAAGITLNILALAIHP